jgi:excisionase family DNA binding protein
MTKPDWTERLLLRMPEVATILGIGRSTVYELVQRGDLPAVHVGRAVRIPSAALQRWVEEQTAEAEAISAPLFRRRAG